MKVFRLASLLLFSASTVYSQKNRTAADTLRLNKEHVKARHDIAELTSKLSIAQNNLPGYHAKAGEATSDANRSSIFLLKSDTVIFNFNFKGFIITWLIALPVSNTYRLLLLSQLNTAHLFLKF